MLHDWQLSTCTNTVKHVNVWFALVHTVVLSHYTMESRNWLVISSQIEYLFTLCSWLGVLAMKNYMPSGKEDKQLRKGIKGHTHLVYKLA